MTVPRNAILKYQGPSAQREYPNISGNTIHSGDAVYVDQTTFDIAAVDSDAHAQYFVGVSEDTYDSSYDAYPGQINPTKMHVIGKGWAKFYTESGLTYVVGQPVYYSTDAQHVTNVPGTNLYGYVADLPDGSQVALVGTGSNFVVISLNRAWPSSSI
jgi:hypothetical protein